VKGGRRGRASPKGNGSVQQGSPRRPQVRLPDALEIETGESPFLRPVGCVQSGVEYKIRFKCPGTDAVAEALRPLPFARELPASEGFELRAAGSAAGMPDAWAKPEPGGLYFCDNGGAGRELLGLVVARLVRQFGVVTVAELE